MTNSNETFPQNYYDWKEEKDFDDLKEALVLLKRDMLQDCLTTWQTVEKWLWFAFLLADSFAPS